MSISENNVGDKHVMALASYELGLISAKICQVCFVDNNPR